jgi:hypothetical protein
VGHCESCDVLYRGAAKDGIILDQQRLGSRSSACLQGNLDLGRRGDGDALEVDSCALRETFSFSESRLDSRQERRVYQKSDACRLRHEFVQQLKSF